MDNSPKVDPEDLDLIDTIITTHKGKQQIAFNYWVRTAVHVQYQKALTQIRKKFGLENKREAVVRGVIYAAAVIDKGAVGRPDARVVGQLSISHGRISDFARKGTRLIGGKPHDLCVAPTGDFWSSTGDS